MTTLNKIPAGLDARYLDGLNFERNCPGFAVWEVLATDGNKYFMASYSEGAIGTRLFFRTDGKLDMTSAVRLGDNEDAKAWCAERGMDY